MLTIIVVRGLGVVTSGLDLFSSGAKETEAGKQRVYDSICYVISPRPAWDAELDSYLQKY